MSRGFMVNMTVMCDDETSVLNVVEKVTRVLVGLALDQHHTSLSISTVDYEEAEQEKEG
jgi:hypothetical protein